MYSKLSIYTGNESIATVLQKMIAEQYRRFSKEAG